MYLKDLHIEKQLEYCTVKGKVKLVKHLFKKYEFDFEVVNVIYQRLRSIIKNHPDLPNINDYIQIRNEFIYVLEPDLFINNIIKYKWMKRAWIKL